MENNLFLTSSTDSPEKFEEWISPAAGKLKVLPPSGGTLKINLELAQFNRVFLFSVGSTAPFCVDGLEGRPHLALTLPVGRGFQAAVNDRLETFTGSVGHLLSPIAPLQYRTPPNNNNLVCNVHHEVISDYSRRLNQDEPLDFIQTKAVSLHGDYGAALRRYLYFLWKEMRLGKGLLTNQLFSQELEETILAAYLLAITESKEDPTQYQARTSAPAEIRRVEDYILSHLSTPLSLADLAGIADMPIRTLLRKFKERHGVSPIQFLRTRRFEAAFAELISQTPSEHSVTETAIRYGFNHLSRFASEYLRRFHELPSETLKRKFS